MSARKVLWTLTVLDKKYGHTTADIAACSADAATRAYLRQPWTEDDIVLGCSRKVFTGCCPQIEESGGAS